MTTKVSAVNTVNGKVIYAEYANKDSKGRKIVDTYATKKEISSISGDVTYLIDEVSAFETTVSGQIETISATTVSGIESLTSAFSELANTVSSTSATLTEEISAFKTEVDEKINTLSASVSGIDYLSAALNTEIERATSAEYVLDEKLTELSANIYNELSAISGDMDYVVSGLSAAIIAETDRAITAETIINGRIDEVSGGMEVVTSAIGEIYTELDTKATKPEDGQFTSGNIPVFNENGDLIDSQLSIQNTISGVMDQAGNSFVTENIAVIPSATSAGNLGLIKISTILI